MVSQVITIYFDGRIAGLQVKPGKGLDLTKFGEASIKRASEIIWDQTEQKWYVEFRSAGQLAGRVLTVSMLAEASGQPQPPSGAETAYFPDYDKAVEAEIAVLNHYRLTDIRVLDS